MSKIDLIKIAKDYGFHVEVTNYPLLENAKPMVKMWIDTQIDYILKATDEAETYIYVAWGVTRKPVNGKINFFNEILIYNDKSNEEYLRLHLNKVLANYKKRCAGLKKV